MFKRIPEKTHKECACFFIYVVRRHSRLSGFDIIILGSCLAKGHMCFNSF